MTSDPNCILVPVKGSKYNPHQSTAERRRRIKQVQRGAVKGPVVTDELRYAAAGLVHPNDVRLI